MERRIPGQPSASMFNRGLLAALLMAVCAALACLGVLRGQAQFSGVISGRVSDHDGLPERLLVHLLAEGEVPAGDTYTDSNGLFAFHSLPSGTYHVVVQVEGYRLVRQAVNLDIQINPRVQVNIALEPLTKTASPNPTISGSPKSYKFDVRRQAKPINPKALHEFEKGNANQRSGDFQGAVHHYQKALRIDPACYPALNNLGTIYLRQKNVGKAKEAFLKLLELNPEEGEGYVNLGSALYQEGEYQAAVERLQEGLQKAPRSAVGHFFLGSAYLKLNMFEQAESNLKTASTLDPSMGSAHLQLANMYLREHKTIAASSELEIYLRANPSDPQAAAIKKMLANLQGH